MKIFAVSDVHGHACQLKAALHEAGYDAEDPEHLFVCCGDCFDRGAENRAVLEFIRSLPRRVLVRGNHEDMLMTVLARGELRYNNMRNGTDLTVEEFAHVEASGKFRISRRAKAELAGFVDEMVDCFETANYVFVHGWIALRSEGDQVGWTDDWRVATRSEWASSRWLEWYRAYEAGLLPEGKTVVCGHRSASYGHFFDASRPRDCSHPFYGDGMIAIDALTVSSGRVNVLVLEDEIPAAKRHTMRLRGDMFDKMAAGRKTAEIRLWDQKRRALRTGDEIEFTHRETGETLAVRVRGVYVYPTLDALLEQFTPAELGFGGKKRSQIRRLISEIYGEKSLSESNIAAICVKKI